MRTPVRRKRRVDDLDARCLHIDEEQRVLARAFEHCLQDHVVGVIGAGDEPFLAVDHIVVAVSAGRGADR
jgi:hypothetical protein